MKLRPWPREQDAAPTADQIARAMVAAARETGDVERLAAAVDGGGLTAIVTRSRWLALEALHVLWPRCPLQTLAEKLGGSAAGSWGSLNTAKSSSWWSDHAVNRIVDAI